MTEKSSNSPVPDDAQVDFTRQAVPKPGMPARPRVDDPGLLAKTFQRMTTTGQGAFAGGGEIIKRRYITFDVDGAECAPDVFVDEGGGYVMFTLTLATLTAGEEVNVTREVVDPGEAAFKTVQASICRLNGAPVVGDESDFVWEALGPKGRQLAVAMYQEIGSLSSAMMGKALASSSRS